jgi:hypothetical protein
MNVELAKFILYLNLELRKGIDVCLMLLPAGNIEGQYPPAYEC